MGFGDNPRLTLPSRSASLLTVSLGLLLKQSPPPDNDRVRAGA